MKVASTLLYLALTTRRLQGFAYAPNFITKIIQEDTGMDPTIEDLVVEKPETKTAKNVKTRFPPEPNGYLHLGHAKAVSFNFAVARMFQGSCNMRMDDTNPSKEDEEYVASILEDVKWIQSGLHDSEVPWDGPVRKTSDYFDTIYDCAEALIKQGDAYVDSLSVDEMREYRGTLTEPGKDSPYRSRSIDENLDLFRKVGHEPHTPFAHFTLSNPISEKKTDESRRIRGRRAYSESENRYELSKYQYARPSSVSHQTRIPSGNWGYVVYLPNV
jgi:glutaminyl-tRNA synthetase